MRTDPAASGRRLFPFPAHSWISQLCLFALFQCASLLVFRQGLVGIPRADHRLFIAERAAARSDSEFFWRMLSFDRTLHGVNPTTYLFRPGRMGALAILDIFFRDWFYLQGTLSILLHGLCCFVLYRTLSKLAGTKLAIAGSLFFLVRFAGFEMVTWTHIALYLPGFILFIVGIGALWQSEQALKPRALGSAFFVSSLFHEAMAIILPLVGFILFLSERNLPPGERTYNRGSLCYLFFLPAFFYFTLSGADYLVRYYLVTGSARQVAVQLSMDHLRGQNVFGLANFCLASAGIFFVQAVAPFWVRYVPYFRLDQKAISDFDSLPQVVYPIVGGLFLSLLFLILRQSFFSPPAGTERRSARVVRLLVVSYFLVLTMGVGILRYGVQGWNYLLNNTYYAYFSAGLLLLLSASYAAEVRAAAERLDRHLRAMITFGAATGMLFAIGWSYRGIQEMLGQRSALEKNIARSVSEISRQLAAHPGYCYAGSRSAVLDRAISPLFLFYRSCQRHSGAPVYAMQANDGRFWLASDHAQPFRQTIDVAQFDVARKILGGDVLVRLSRRAFPLVSGFTFRIAEGASADLVFNFRDSRNYFLLSVRPFRITVSKVADGVGSDFDSVLRAVGGREISIEENGGDLLLLEGGSVIARLNGVSLEPGKLGVVVPSADSPWPLLGAEANLDRPASLVPLFPLALPDQLMRPNKLL